MRIVKALLITALLLLTGCAWYRGRADKRTARQVVFDMFRRRPPWTTYLEFHNFVEKNKSYFRLDDFRICYIEKGQGEAVLLLHGLFGSKNVWRANFMEFAKKFRVVAVDMPGSGDSDNPHHTIYPYTPEKMAQTVLLLMDYLNIKKAHIVGNSLGGLIALIIARDHPDRVKSLVLIAPSVWDYTGKLEKLIGSLYGIGPALATARPTDELVNSILNSTVLNPHVLTDADRYEASMSLLQEGARDAMIEKARRLFKIEYLKQISPTFSGLKVRTLIVWGEEDSVIPPFVAHMLYEQLPNSRILWIPQCGHHPQEETPRLFNREVMKFLSEGETD